MMRPARNEDKQAWCDEYGPKTERKFCDWATQVLGVDVMPNPAKDQDPYTFDLLYDGKPADLKTVRTPFFMAEHLYGIDPQFAVTFNHKDGQRYREHYPSIRIVFDVKFDGGTLASSAMPEPVHVQPMHLVAIGTLDQVSRAITDSGFHRHDYQARVNDTEGNAKASWLLDVRKLTVLHHVDPR